jgi:cell division protein FtsQ
VLYDFATTSPQFALASSDQIEVAGITHVARAQVIDRFASDLGRNIFFIPLERRLGGIRQIAWVRSAAVLRIWPNRLQVRIAEREPVAFARFGSTLQLIDADGVLLDRSRVSERPPSSQNADQRHDFPVLVGLPRGDAALSERRERVRQYVGLTQELDSGETPHSQDLSEVNLSDPDDMQVTVTSPNSVTVIIHLGDHDFLRRYNLYLNHIEEWRHAFPRLSSVDLRYSGQAIINQQ